MSEDNLRLCRQTARLKISIPVVTSGVDADGDKFNESVHTQVVNAHGGKIATTHHLAMGTEVLVENRAMGVLAKASVVWLGEEDYAGDSHLVGLELLEAQNVWGITFPPDDWRPESGEEMSPAPKPS